MNAGLHRDALVPGARLQHRQRCGLPFPGLPFPCSSQGKALSVYSEIRYFPTPPLGDSSPVRRAAGQLFLMIMKEAIPTIWYILCHQGALQLRFSDDQGITLDASLPGMALRKLLSLADAYTLSLYIIFFFCLHRQHICIFNSK